MSDQGTLPFLGGVGTATGSKYLLTVSGRREPATGDARAPSSLLATALAKEQEQLAGGK